jgi:cytochrome c5
VRPELVAVLALALLAGCGGGGGGAAGESAAAEDPAAVTYRRYCYSCHYAGVGAAPRTGDADAWAPRAAQGWDVLMTHTIDGLRAMPPRGLCRQCSDEDLAAVVAWMLARSGGLPPDAPEAVRNAVADPAP